MREVDTDNRRQQLRSQSDGKSKGKEKGVRIGCWRYTLIVRIAVTISIVTSIRKCPNCAIPFSNSVSGGLSFNFAEIFPNSVSSQVKIDTAFPLPLTTLVPIQREFVCFPSGVSAFSIPVSFSTGKVSPVRMTSLTKRFFESRIRQSAGTVSPDLK